MLTEIYDDECPYCKKTTVHEFTGSGHQRDSFGDKETCLACGAYKGWDQDHYVQDPDYNIHLHYIRAYDDLELNTELVSREKARIAAEAESRKKRTVMVECPLCKGRGEFGTDHQSGYPNTCICCSGKKIIEAVRTKS